MSTLTAVTFQGQACHQLTLPSGDSVLVAEQGAHVLSWVAQGRERMFLSPANVWDGHSAIRGGVPVCWPQFNMRGTLPKHGFARNSTWQLVASELNADASHLTFEWRSSAQTQTIWPQAFVAQLQVSLSAGSLQTTLQVHNTDTQALSFTGALHTYLAVDDIDLADLQGLGGIEEWDAVVDVHGVADDVLYFDGEFDRVYARDVGASAHALRLQDGHGVLHIEQSPTWANTVVWNPGENNCAALADMPSDGFAHMLCVEAAQVYVPVQVPAGGQWLGWQRLTVS
jgi:glucose-6-phosphate 1-epimerase